MKHIYTRLAVVLILVLGLTSCTTWEAFKSHDTAFASWRHMRFSVLMVGHDYTPTAEDCYYSDTEGWWGVENYCKEEE